MIAVVGGGISGMRLAEIFRQSNKEVVLIEKETELGGQCLSVEKDGTNFDRFYHVFYAKDRYFRGLITQLGLDNEVEEINPTQGVVSDKRICPLSSVTDFAFFPFLTFTERIKLFWTLLRGLLTTNWHSLENILAKEWLIQHGGQRVFEQFWQPMLRTKFSDGIDKLSAVDIWARINRFISFGSRGRMCYLKGKLLRLITAYEKKLLEMDIQIQKNNAVLKLIIEDDKVVGLQTTNGLIECDNVVFAAPVPELVNLIPDTYSEYRSSLKRISYIGNVCLVIMSRRQLTPYYMLALKNASSPFTAIIGLSNLYGSQAYNGYHVYYLSHYFLDKLDIYNKPDAQIFEEFFSHLASTIDVNKNDIKGYFVSRVRYNEPLYIVNYVAPQIVTPIRGLYLVSGAQIYPRTPVINSSVELAEKSASIIMDHMK